jgi:hypothetical protein
MVEDKAPDSLYAQLAIVEDRSMKSVLLTCTVDQLHQSIIMVYLAVVDNENTLFLRVRLHFRYLQGYE